jgi:hypothetical protein
MEYTDNKSLSDTTKKITTEGSEAQKANYKGINGKPKIDAFPGVTELDGEVYYHGNNGQYISFTRDRTSGATTGRGGKGYPNASAIRLVAGHFGASLDYYKAREDQTVQANPNMNIDSAYIYISQMSDPDENLNIASGSVGNIKGKSSIVLKADAIRLVSDRGLKLITQRTSVDSKREGHSKVRGIDLIAGNDDTALQPIAKADNAIKAFEELYDLVGRFMDTVVEALHWQHQANLYISTHEHITTQEGFPTATADPRMNIATAGAALKFEEINTVKLNLMRQELTEMNNRFLKKVGDDYIGSLYNNTN